MSRKGGNGREPELPAEAPAASAEPAREAESPAQDPSAAAAVESSETGLVEVGPVQEDAQALRRERDELRDSLLRRRAEFENYRRRVERDQGQAAVDAAADVLQRLVGTVDNLERALASGGSEATLRQGVELTFRELSAALEAQGVTAIDPAGQRFDPTLHQALLHEPVPGLEEGTVAEVFRKGYTYKGRLLRPALVKVASGGPADGGETGDAGSGGDIL
jgi:molecular chaperone GrpE